MIEQTKYLNREPNRLLKSFKNQNSCMGILDFYNIKLLTIYFKLKLYDYLGTSQFQ